MVLGSATVVGEAGPAVEVCSSAAVVLGSVSAVVKVKPRLVLALVSATAVVLGSVSAVGKIGPVVEVCSSTTGVLESVSVVGEVKIGAQVGIGRSLVVIKGISLSLTSPLDLFERALIITTSTTTHTSTITVIAAIVPVSVVAVVEVDVHTANDIDPGESANMRFCFALEFTQETPQSICSKDVALLNIPYMLVTAETSQADRSWLKDCAL